MIVTEGLSSILLLAGAYLLGSIPFGLLLTKLAGKGDIRAQGSGNIGATNVLRAGSYWLGLLTLVADIGKGVLAVALTSTPALAIAAGLLAFAGHVFPIWLRFRGGKGVAVYVGALFLLMPPLAGIFVLVWLVVLGLTRYVSLASLVGAFVTLLASIFVDPVWQFALPCAVLLLWTHHDNIQRLRAGQEPKLGRKK